MQSGLRFVSPVPLLVGDARAPGTASCVYRAAVNWNKE